MKKVKFVYEIYQDGQKKGKTSVTVPANADAFTVVEEKLRARYDVERFNHAGKTISVR